MNRLLLLFFISCSLILPAQSDTTYIKVHFFYGSKPKMKYHKVESKRFGGLHGGHVSMELNDTNFGFLFKGRVHIFSHKKNLHSHWVTESNASWVNDTINDKYATVLVPLTGAQLQIYNQIKQEYLNHTPYDYAFFGMRCAASTYDMFSQMGFFKHRSRFGMVSKIFYPKLLRKRFLKLAQQNQWEVIRHEGSSRRKWERR